MLVLPALEAWFLRTSGGLDAVRDLLGALSRTERRCVVGCNSWAWSYLCKAADAQSFLPPALTFQAFGADELRRWFGAMSPARGRARFRISATGAGLFAEPGDGSQERRR